MNYIFDGVKCAPGHALPFGASLTGDGGINFSINSKDAEACILELYKKDNGPAFANIRIPQEFKKGNNYSIIVYGLDPKMISYNYRFEGRYEPSEGLRFNPDWSLLDPYAKSVTGREEWHKDVSLPMRGKILTEEFRWDDNPLIDLSYNDLIIYEMHVRGFTNDPASKVKCKGTYNGIVEKISYLKDLGINCIELLPVFEFDDLEDNGSYNGEPLYNYWGYNTVSFFAPKAAYAKSNTPDGIAHEFKNMVQELHRNGIKIILDVVFNHTAEYNGKLGLTYNFRGIDNRSYYILDENGEYADYTACGNTFKCNDPMVAGFIVDCLRYWKDEYHVDGFRFDEGAILSRSATGEVMSNPLVLDMISKDPILADAILIAEAIDASGLYQVGCYPADSRWGEWNDKFSHCIRKFIKSDESAGPELIKRIKGSPDIYNETYTHFGVNYVTCHDGFTMNDLVSYNDRHNIENGWNNEDGIHENYSWNCGVEGESDDKEIESLRSKQVKNAFALLMLSRGVPMMLAGDEIRNGQKGNNNVFSQDSEISWINWKNEKAHKDVHDFFKEVIKLRQDHPVLRSTYKGTDKNSSDYPELSFHGTTPWELDENAPFLTFGFMYAETKADHNADEDCFIYCGVNAFWEDQTLGLPIVPEGFEWSLYVTSANRKYKKTDINDSITLEPRSLIILIAKKTRRSSK